MMLLMGLFIDFSLKAGSLSGHALAFEHLHRDKGGAGKSKSHLSG